jgi:hypothetical protein
MLYRQNPAQATPAPREIVGRRLAKRLAQGRISPTHAALLALELECGALWLHHLGRRQAQRLTGANLRHVTSLRRASAEQREQVKKGLLPLAELTPRAPGVPTDADVDRVVRELGADRVMAALDRITRPSLVAAE